MKLVIGNKNYSSWSLRPWFYLRQMGVKFEEEMVSLDLPDTHRKLGAYQSNFKVPVLVDGDHQVWDSLAIIEYVADKHALVDVWPVDIKARSHARSMAAEMHSSFAALRSAMPMNIRRTIEGFQPDVATQRDIDRIHWLWRYARKKYGQQGPWLFGEFSAVDAMFAPVVMRFAGFQMGGQVARDEVIEAYQQQLIQSKPIQDWIAAAKLETEMIEQDEV